MIELSVLANGAASVNNDFRRVILDKLMWPPISFKPPTRATPVAVAAVLLPGFFDASVGATFSIAQAANAMRRAQGLGDLFQLRLVSPQAPQLKSSAGLPVATEPLARLAEAELIVVPGAFIDGSAAMHEWLALAAVHAWLDHAVRLAPHQHVAASCAGTWTLAEAGLLDGRLATSVWWLSGDFRLRYPQVQLDMNSLVVSDGPCTTAGAAFAHVDLMLHLVARWGGSTLAERCARYLLLDQRQAQGRHHKLAWLVQGDPLMSRMHSWVEQHLARTFEITSLAQALSLTPRTLARRTQQALGLSPWRVVQRQRVEAAVHLLQTTHLPFEKISLRVGYADASALRRLIHRELGQSPQALRAPQPPKHTRAMTRGALRRGP